MTPLTRCDLRRMSQPILRPASLFRILLLFALVAGLALARVQLRFETQDLKLETRDLQRRQVELLNRKKALVCEVEEKRYQTCQVAAREGGMAECPPDRSRKATVSLASIERWSSIEEQHPSEQDTLSSQRPRENLIAAVGERMISWSSPAQAREAD